MSFRKLSCTEKKDFKKARKLALPDLKIIFEVVSTLEEEASLDAKYKDLELIGNWSNLRECHIPPDSLLIYKKMLLGCSWLG